MNLYHPKTTYFHPINVWNSIYTLAVFPVSLGVIKFFPQFAGFAFAITLVLMMLYYADLFRLRYSMYVVPIGFYITSAMFLRVSAGNTIPPNVIIIGLSFLYFFTLDVVVYQQEKLSEFARQISLSAVVLMLFTGYAYIFGLKFISPNSDVQMVILSLILNFSLGYWFLQTYRIEKVGLVNLIFLIVGLQAIWILRLFPYGHLTLSFLYTTLFFGSLYIAVKYIQTQMTKKAIISRVGVLIGMTVAILLTSSLTI